MDSKVKYRFTNAIFLPAVIGWPYNRHYLCNKGGTPFIFSQSEKGGKGTSSRETAAVTKQRYPRKPRRGQEWKEN